MNQRIAHHWRNSVLLFCLLLLMTAPLPALAQPLQAQAVQPAAVNVTTSSEPDAFEPDNSCAEAKTIATDGSTQAHNLFTTAERDQDWVSFPVVSGKRYEIVTKPDGERGADVALTLFLYPHCDDVEVASSEETMKFSAAVDGAYFVKIKHKLDVYGDQTDYLLSVTEKDPLPRTIPLSAAPVEIVRRVSDFVDEVRGGELAPNWTDARLAATVSVLYRPDMGDKPAYYEFPIEAPDQDGNYQPAGFVQLSTDTHDYPITHWNVEGTSPTQELDNLAALSDGEVNQYYKLDALAYTAEFDQPMSLGVSMQSAEIVRLGNLPPKAPEDLALPLSGDPVIENGLWDPPVDDDTAIDPNNPMTTELVVEGDDIPVALATDEWQDWDDLKSGYGENYGVLLAALKQDAAADWGTEILIEEVGEALTPGDERTVHALAGRTLVDIAVTGTGADANYLRQERLAEGTLPTAVKLTVLAAPDAADVSLPISVTLTYEGNVQEVKKFTIIGEATNNIYLPLVHGARQVQVQAASGDAAQATNGSWSAWRYWWAATPTAGYITYDQLPANRSPNNKPCWSGCVPTAWAMMFAWADIRATIPNSGWNHRWGIYRDKGGYGANAVAPYRMYGDAQSPGIHNVMMELNGHMGTYCGDGSGWTKNDRMNEAWKYLKNRSGAQLQYKRTSGWWIFGTSGDEVRDYAISQVKAGRPVVIAREGHAPLVYGYAERSRSVKSCFLFICKTNTEYSRWFYVNQGWGGAKNGWVSAKASFAGTLTP